jgi:signal transduction histidine kinase
VEERKHRLEVKLPAEPLRLEADPDRLKQVLGNLLANAAKYTPPGGTIRLTADSDGGETVLRVQDSGIGIRPESLDGIFELFSQADQVAGHSREGLGIGLTLVRRLVELHGGGVRACSAGRAGAASSWSACPYRRVKRPAPDGRARPRP